ncbi:MAG: hypothetical protein FJ095_01050 [Deltaproteobacteria bacterium]|nr:hypothetical protein [Deltaproteobacteria bacterium]
MPGTHVRGGASTPDALKVDGWWRLAASPRRAFRVAVAVALLAHLPLAPTLVPPWLRGLLRMEEAPTPLSEEVVVPIDLDMGFEDEAPPPQAEQAPEPVEPEVDEEAEATALRQRAEREKAELEKRDKAEREKRDKAEREKRDKAEREKRDKAERERLASASATASASAAPPAPTSSASAQAVAGPAPSASSSATPAGRSAAPIEDATKLAGQPGAVQAKATNVMIYLATDVVRRHELGPLFGDLLARIPQWRELLGGTNLDALRDFDHVWLTGPHMQSARVVVAVVDYNVGVGHMQRAIETAMAASDPPGKWLTRTPAPLGVLGAGGAQRVSLRADKHVVVVAPAEAEEQLRQAKDLRFNKSGSTLFAATLRTPWRAFMHTPLRFPKSIALLRLTATPSGEALSLKLEATDTNPAAAEATSRELAEAIEEVRDPPILAPWFDKPTFEARDGKIVGEVVVTNVQLRRILNLVGGFLSLQKQ